MSDPDQVQAASEAITKFGSAVSSSAERLGKLEDMMSTASKLTKLGAGLGLMGAGLGMIATLAGAKSDADRILDAIAALSTQVNNLEKNMQERLEHLENVVKQTAAKTQLFPYLANLKSLNELMDDYRQQAAIDPNSQLAITYRNSMRDFSTAFIKDAATAIHMQLTEESLATNILNATYRLTFGDVRLLSAIGGTLFSYLNFALVADVFLQTLGENEDHKPSEGEIASYKQLAHNFYYAKINEAYESWKLMIDKCFSNMSENVEGKTRELMDGEGFPGDHKEAAIYLHDKLREHYFWNDWIAIVYDPVEGYGTHGMWGWDYKAIFREHGVNVVVKWVHERQPAKGASWSTLIESYFEKVMVPTYQVGVRGRRGTGERGKITRVDDTNIAKVKAEDDIWWVNIDDLGMNMLTPPVSYPGFVWRCKRFKGVYGCWTNSARVKWVNGLYATICIYF